VRMSADTVDAPWLIETPSTDTMDTWDDEKLRSVIISKHGNPRTTTDVRLYRPCFSQLPHSLLVRSCANSSLKPLNHKSAFIPLYAHLPRPFRIASSVHC
jgi:hypothetical protein